MRNLKRALSLTLASIMLLGMMVVGSSAKGYDDVTENNNVEAIEVLQAIEVMVGDERGFGPDRPVNRAEMAVVMGKLLSLDYDYYATSCPFNDVYDWARGWVGAAYANKIVSGRGEGVYDPGSTVTAVEAASMLMRALGYFQYANDVADGFELSTVRQGTKIGIFDGVGSSATAPMTRNQVAQMVLNALQSDVVEPDGNTINLTTPDGTVLTGKVNYVSVTRDEPYAWAIDDTRASSIGSYNEGWIVELGERLYNGDLRLNDGVRDAFGRPSRQWEYKGEEIGTYAKKELLRKEYTTEVTGKDLYDLLGSNTVDTYTAKVFIDGVDEYLTVSGVNNAVFDRTSIKRSNQAGVGATGNGVKTEVYVNTDKKEFTIAIINTYLAIADDDYSERYNNVGLDVYAIAKHAASGEYIKYNPANTTSDSENLDVLGEDFDIKNVKKDDKFLVTVAQGEVQSMAEPETIADVEISSFRQGKSLVTGGTEYKYTTTVEYDYETLEDWTDGGSTVNLKDINYNVYLDQYGYVIGVKEIEVPDNYLFITGVNGNYNNLANMTMQANAIFLDGTMDTVTINTKKSDFGGGAGAQGIRNGDETDSTLNRWFTYSKSNDNVYTVKLVTIDAGLDKVGQSDDPARGTSLPGDVIDYKHNSTGDRDDDAGNRVYGNDKTVYITASIDLINTADNIKNVVIDDVDNVAVGIDNVDITPWPVSTDTVHGLTASGGNKSTSSGIYSLYNKDGYIIAMVVVGEDNGNADSLAYIHSGSVYDEAYSKDTKLYTWTRTAIVDGKEVTLTEVDDTNISMLQNMDEAKWYRVRYNAKGEVVKVRAEQSATLDQDIQFDDWNLNSDSYRYVTDYTGGNINNAINTAGVKTVLYHEAFTNDKPHNSGKTLYMTQLTNDAYIRFTDDTNVVFEQWVNNTKWNTTFWTGESGVNRAIKELHEVASTPAEDYNYTISAVIEDGRATSIIIRDTEQDGDGGTPPVVVTGVDVVFSNRNNNYANPRIHSDDWSTETIFGALQAQIEKDGGTNVRYTVADATDVWGTGNVLSYDVGNVTYQVTGANIIRLYSIKLDGTLIGYTAYTAAQWAAGSGQTQVKTDGYTANSTTYDLTAAPYTGTFNKQVSDLQVDHYVAAASWVPATTKDYGDLEYVTGYYEVTAPTVSAIDGITVTTTVNGVAGPIYLKKDATFTVTYTFGGTYTNTTGGTGTVTPANATTPNVTAGTAITGLDNVTYGVASNVLTITKAAAATTATGTPALTLTYTVTGSGDVAFS